MPRSNKSTATDQLTSQNNASILSQPIFERFFDTDYVLRAVATDVFARLLEVSHPTSMAQYQAVERTKLSAVELIQAEPNAKLSTPDQAAQTYPGSSQIVLSRFKTGLAKTRAQFSKGLNRLFSQGGEFDANFFDALETQLILADVGVTTTTAVVEQLRQVDTSESKHSLDQTRQVLRQALHRILVATLVSNETKPQVPVKNVELILVVGVNGAGKTTTIGKLANRYLSQGRSVLLAAGDTFRAAASEQLQVWSQRTGAACIVQGQGADSASVIFDALQSGQAKGVDVVIADTAGRLHNKSNLMAELKKIARVVKKLDPLAPHQVLLVIDGCAGQNALAQGKAFHEAIPLTGLVVTKLDGTAKGGIVLALSQSLQIGVEYIGIGEGIDDLREFHAEEFVTALLEHDFNHAS